MPTYLTPGVYVEEVDSGSKPLGSSAMPWKNKLTRSAPMLPSWAHLSSFSTRGLISLSAVCSSNSRP